MKSFQNISKILIITLMCAVLPVPALASFYDGEASAENGFSAAKLDLGLEADDISTDGRTDTLTGEAGTILFEYRASMETSGATDLCAGLSVEVYRNGSSTSFYEGSTTGFSYASAEAMDENDSATFEYHFSADENAVYTQNCSVRVVYKANQVGYEYDEAFYDTEKDTFTLFATDFGTKPTGPVQASSPMGVVLNEVLPNPEGGDSQDGTNGEWLEFYNNGTTTIDMAGWYITDNTGGTVQTVSSGTTMREDTTIESESWLVLFMNDSTLNNTGDTITLYDENGLEQDSYSYGDTSNDDDSNSESTIDSGNTSPSGGLQTGNEGKSYARIPDGSTNWVDPFPTPGRANELKKNTLGSNSHTSSWSLAPLALSIEPPASTTPAVSVATPTGSTTTDIQGGTSTEQMVSGDEGSTGASQVDESTGGKRGTNQSGDEGGEVEDDPVMKEEETTIETDGNSVETEKTDNPAKSEKKKTAKPKVGNEIKA